MKLYKYKATSRLDHVLDIILNERLFCAPYNQLNDPFEGLFTSRIKLPKRRIPRNLAFFVTAPVAQIKVHNVDELIMGKAAAWRVCSLSADPSEVRLWSHYADAHRGVAIEVDFTGYEAEVKKVIYEPTLRQFSLAHLSKPSGAKVLQYKTDHWSYEAEYRVISATEFHKINGRITGVYCGPRMDRETAQLIRKAVPSSIPLFRTALNRHKLKVETDVAFV